LRLVRAGLKSGVPVQPVRHPVVLAVAATTSAVLPVFLLGALSVQMTRALDFKETGVGLAVAVFFAGAAVGSLVSGHVAERTGISSVMRLGTLGSACCLAAIAIAARSLLVLMLILAFAGLADGLIQPAVNAFLSGRVAAGRQGFAFGVKQSAVPLSTLLGGLAVPAIALTVGWRWAFAASAVLALAAVAALPSRRRLHAPAADDRHAPVDVPGQRADGHRSLSSTAILVWPLVALAVAGGIAAGAANALGTFLVSASVSAHFAEGLAGLLAAAGSVCSILTRVTITTWAGRREGNLFAVVAIMLTFGAAGYALLASEKPILMVFGALIAFAGGWGWNGLFTYAVVRSHPHSPAKATGITQAGIFVGAVIIPSAFGLLVDRVSYTAAWSLAAGLALAAAAVMVAGGRLLIAHGARGSTGDDVAYPPTLQGSTSQEVLPKSG